MGNGKGVWFFVHSSMELLRRSLRPMSEPGIYNLVENDPEPVALS